MRRITWRIAGDYTSASRKLTLFMLEFIRLTAVVFSSDSC